MYMDTQYQIRMKSDSVIFYPGTNGWPEITNIMAVFRNTANNYKWFKMPVL